MTVRLFWIVLLALACPVACDESRAPTSPPHCEPPEELEIERALKRGYRAVAEGEMDVAARAFRDALEAAPDHPEAHEGLRLIRALRRRHAPRRSRIKEPDPPPPPAPAGGP